MKRLLGKLYGYQKYEIPCLNYEQYWGSRTEEREKHLKKRDVIINQVVSKNSSVLDIGCGDGRLLKYLVDKKNIHAEGFDVSDTALERAKKKGLNVYKFDLNSDVLNLEKEYDHIIISEVIEHIPDPESLLAKVQDKFSKSLILSFPNMGHLKYRLRFLLGRFPECWSWHPGEHIRFWTKTDMIFWLERKDNGFDSLVAEKFHPCVGKNILLNLSNSLFAGDYVVEVVRKNT
jgi:methionine biosynthesis protein MetW